MYSVINNFNNMLSSENSKLSEQIKHSLIKNLTTLAIQEHRNVTNTELTKHRIKNTELSKKVIQQNKEITNLNTEVLILKEEIDDITEELNELYEAIDEEDEEDDDDDDDDDEDDDDDDDDENDDDECCYCSCDNSFDVTYTIYIEDNSNQSNQSNCSNCSTGSLKRNVKNIVDHSFYNYLRNNVSLMNYYNSKKSFITCVNLYNYYNSVMKNVFDDIVKSEIEWEIERMIEEEKRSLIFNNFLNHDDDPFASIKEDYDTDFEDDEYDTIFKKLN